MKNALMLLVLAVAPMVAVASSDNLSSLSDEQLVERWNKQAVAYNPAYALTNCRAGRAAANDGSFLTCGLSEAPGAVSIRRRGRTFDSVEYYLMGGHPISGASMFMRFVRGRSMGDMSAVGTRLLHAALSSRDGNACVADGASRVCAVHRDGVYAMDAR